MSNDSLRLIEPTLGLRDDFHALAVEYLAEGDARYRDAVSNFEGFIQLCADEAMGRNLASDRVPQSTLWCVRNEARIVGCSRLRHTLNAFLEEEGGHIGYDTERGLTPFYCPTVERIKKRRDAKNRRRQSELLPVLPERNNDDRR